MVGGLKQLKIRSGTEGRRVAAVLVSESGEAWPLRGVEGRSGTT